MQPHTLIALLVTAAGGTAKVARDMRSPSFQGTLHKICSGHVRSPKRESAERIAQFFNIPVDAVYDPAAAQRVAEERQLKLPLQAQEPPALYRVDPIGTAPERDPAPQFKRELDAVGRLLREVAPELRRPLGAMLDSWAQAGGAPELRDSIEHLLRAASAFPRDQGHAT